ncbi:uncharacterized protein PHACADRAFT_248221 [Phanerochaete carnosa HHB-10118-sp]|uniref:Uncharacterized protein n=1 Tax=Phanerochaete carnosa (strain HHB-10118-sp) TaxID=650164 RepID=K5WC61_PHACS|nr:uncharacterized protein PHACADRAFT_248221 [Phanerochaete carnosa HHB-10118-sp]EKM61543.1 hypothetical protein PHACADRAFT_248221 [Phanerochaete carnosa HHB-10118-sp]
MYAAQSTSSSSSSTAVYTPVLFRTTSSQHECTSSVTHNAPQCCHCGWRGDHAPTCPFK